LLEKTGGQIISIVSADVLIPEKDKL
jgi:hypothetical protein